VFRAKKAVFGWLLGFSHLQISLQTFFLSLRLGMKPNASFVARVTRLGKFQPIGRLFTLDSFAEN
jgi:hypothetical protein